MPGIYTEKVPFGCLGKVGFYVTWIKARWEWLWRKGFKEHPGMMRTHLNSVSIL